MKVTTYRNFHTPVEDKEFLDLIEEVKAEKYASEIKAIRYAFHQGNDSLGEKLKKDLVAFTPSGIFLGGRTLKCLKTYTGLAHLDIDDLRPEEVESMRNLVNDCQYTYASFVSPSGLGLKIFIRVVSGEGEHKIAIQQLMDFYEELTGVPCDPKCKDITRLCFLSWDENAYVNEQSELFTPLVVEKEEVANVPLDHTPKSIEYCVSFTEKVSTYAEGNRNSHVYLIARNANRFGIHEEEILDYCLTSFDLSQQEITASVKSAYKHNVVEFAKFANIATTATTELTQTEKDQKEEDSQKKMAEVMKNTPFIPNNVFDTLPSILKESCSLFDDKRERDVFLTSSIAILSGCLPNVTGLYFSSTIYTNLYSFIIAPPASGKGSMNFAKMLADAIHENLLAESKEKQKAYKVELREYKKRHQGKGAKDNSEEEEPVEPPFKVLYVPANTSSSKVYEHIEKNEGKGIICETEADTLGIVFKNDWGSYSDLLRKAFHHERISISRKTDNLYFEVENPQLSVVLTGTPNQIVNIIQSAEDGLFSRFLFYTFSAEPVWKSPAPQPGKPDFSKYFKEKAQEIFRMQEMLECNPTVVSMSVEQWREFNSFFEEVLIEINELVSSEATSVVKRLGLIFFRICLIFTALRKFENGDTTGELECEEIDFQNTKQIVKVLLEHSIILYTNLPGADKEFKITKSTKKQTFFNALPTEFKRKEAVEIGKEFKIPTRTVDNLIGKVWLGFDIEKVDTGMYRKLNK
jgi:hypothetical protein